MKSTLSFLLVLLLGLGGSPAATEHPEQAAAKAAPVAAGVSADVLQATVTGKNVCLGVELKKDSGLPCSAFGNRHALLVSKVEVDGKPVPGLDGVLLSYLDTDEARPYINGHDGETLTLKGMVFRTHHIFEVTAGRPQDKAARPAEHPGKSEHPDHPRKADHPEHPGH
jgi:hypothetical protein